MHLRAAPGEHDPAAARCDMTYVADTHALVFFASGQLRRMSPRCRSIFRRAEEERDRVHGPAVRLFEVALK